MIDMHGKIMSGLMMTVVVATLEMCSDCSKPPVVPEPQDADADVVVVVSQIDATPMPVAAVDATVPPSVNQLACAALKTAGCPEAASVDGGDTCVQVFDKAEASGKYTLKPACVAACSTAACVRACGTVRCIGVK